MRKAEAAYQSGLLEMLKLSRDFEGEPAAAGKLSWAGDMGSEGRRIWNSEGRGRGSDGCYWVLLGPFRFLDI